MNFLRPSFTQHMVNLSSVASPFFDTGDPGPEWIMTAMGSALMLLTVWCDRLCNDENHRRLPGGGVISSETREWIGVRWNGLALGGAGGAIWESRMAMCNSSEIKESKRFICHPLLHNQWVQNIMSQNNKYLSCQYLWVRKLVWLCLRSSLTVDWRYQFLATWTSPYSYLE